MPQYFVEPLDEKTEVLKLKYRENARPFGNGRNQRENENHTVWLHAWNFGI
jgi:hypothetical protein